MSKALNYASLFLFFGIVLSSLPFQATGQPTTDQSQNSPSSPIQLKAVPLPHLYWQFLLYVTTLDTKAAELDSQGKDGSGLRNDLQKGTGFSDAEFAAVRDSSRRFTADLHTLNATATGNNAGNQEPVSAEASPGLKREALLNREIAYLTQSLSPEKKASLDSFLTQFYAPKQLSATINPSQNTAIPEVLK